MRCWALTRTFSWCKNKPTNIFYPFCYKHRFQPFIYALTLITLIAGLITIYNRFLSPEARLEREFKKFEIPSLDSEQQFKGASVSILFKVVPQSQFRRKYIFDIAESEYKNRISLYLDPNNIMVFSLLDNNGENYTLRFPPNEFMFDKFMFLYCEYGISSEFSFMRLFIDNKLIEQQKFMFQIFLPTDSTRKSTIMADINGNDNTVMTVASYSFGDHTMGKTDRRKIYNVIKYYMKSINHPYSRDE